MQAYPVLTMIRPPASPRWTQENGEMHRMSAPFQMVLRLPPSKFFPPAELAAEEGLLCVGGRLDPDWLLDAYSHGIFPWPLFSEGEEMVWWSPDPRAVFPLDHLRLPRRLLRTCRSGRFEVSCNRDFADVIRGCATAQDRRGATWLSGEMIRAFIRLHKLGHAHSVEVWSGGRLAGGTYGVALGGVFAAESKFHYVRDASKVALAHLLAHVIARGYQLFDIQQLTDHTAALGAIHISREEYLARLAAALQAPVTFGERLEGDPYKLRS